MRTRRVKVVAPRPRILIGGVGYRFTRDLSFGPLLIDRLHGAAWLDGIEVEDLSYAPIAIVHRWQEAPYDRVILVGAMARGRLAGTLCRYCPTLVLPDPEEIQERVGEALTGIISLENLVIVTQHFGVLPRDAEVIEVEPHDLGWGDGLSPQIRDVMAPAIEMVRDAVGRATGEHAAATDGEEAAVEGLRQRDEILQVLYWLEGEGLAPDVRAADLSPFIEGDEAAITVHLEILRRQGYLEETRNEAGRYRLSVIGRGEGRRRFTEEFAPLLRQGHGECNDPNCDCHITGDPATCLRRGAAG
ncbi:MAG: hydrogenase maturation protease [Armatimonadota bacterium]